MSRGLIRNRSGDVYKPSAIRSYADALRLHVLPELGARKLTDVQRRDVQRLADDLLAAGREPSTIRNALMPLRVIYRQAVADRDVGINPCTGVRLPAVRSRRERIVSAREAASLLDALHETEDRALWALALYAGLRRGELMALRWEDVDLEAGVLRVERAWDPKSRVYVEPKSRAGRRTVPIASALKDALLAHKPRAHGELVVAGPYGPFDAGVATARATQAWRAAGLAPITLHEARHTFASLMIAAGVNAKALTAYMGHASVTITYDRYGHLMPGNEREAAALLDAYLEAAA